MKIAHLVSTYPPYKGGMGNVCFKEAEGLAKFGHKITVFTPFYKNTHSEHQASDVKVVYLKPFFKMGNAAFVPQILSFLKGFDVVHLHWPFIGGAEKILLKKELPPLVVQYHMDLIDRGFRGLFFKFYQSIFLKKMVEAAEKILVSSFDYLEYSALGKFYKAAKEKFEELPLGVDLDVFSPQPQDELLKEKYNLGEKRVILFVGALDRAHYFKGLSILLEALTKTPKNIILLVVGEGDLKKDYEDLAQELKISERTVFVGSIGLENLVRFYNLADVFVLPSISSSEAFGLVLLEAGACAKPILVSDLPGPRTLVKEGTNGFLIKPGDVNDLAEKIKLIFRTQPQEMGERGRKMVLEKYDSRVLAKKLEAIYEKII